jgi:hypothetical protein
MQHGFYICSERISLIIGGGKDFRERVGIITLGEENLGYFV